MGSISPEQVFLKYALPCAHILVTQNRISQEELDELKQAAFSDKIISKDRLEEIFDQAFRRMKEISGDDFWTVDNIRSYFRNLHNDYIVAGEGNYAHLGDTFKDLCKVHCVVIERIINPEKLIAEVTIDGQKRPVFLNMVPDTKVGEEVYIHHAFAVEKV